MMCVKALLASGASTTFQYKVRIPQSSSRTAVVSTQVVGLIHAFTHFHIYIMYYTVLYDISYCITLYIILYYMTLYCIMIYYIYITAMLVHRVIFLSKQRLVTAIGVSWKLF